MCGIIFLKTYLQWLWCLSRLCEVASAYGLETVDCMMMTEMIHTLVILLESAAERRQETQHAGEALGSPTLFPSILHTRTHTHRSYDSMIILKFSV